MSKATFNYPWWVTQAIADKTPFRDHHITKGYGSGGTYGAALWHLHRCFFDNQKAGVSWAVAPTFAQIEDPVISTLVEVLRDHYKLEVGDDYELNISGRPKITLPGGHVIRFKTASRPSSLVAENISHLWATEPGLYEDLVFERLTGRVRAPNATVHQRLFEGTPEGMTAWEKLANFPEGIDAEKNARRFIVETTDNWRLPEGFIKKLESSLSHDPAKLASYTKGLFMPFIKGLAYWDFRESRELVFNSVIDPNLPIILSFDFNKWPLAFVIMQKNTKRILDYSREVFIQINESTGDARGLLDALADFLRKVPPALHGHQTIEIHGDRSGYSGSHRTAEEGSDYDVITRYLRERFRSVVLKTPDSNPLVKDRLNQHNRMFAYERYKIDARCRNTIRSYQQTKLKDGEWKVEKPPGEDVTHFGEAAGYALFEETKNQDFEIPTKARVYGITR